MAVTPITMRETPDDRAGLLYDYAVGRPDGFTNVEAMDELGWRGTMFRATVRRLRLILGDDEITLVCDPQHKNEPWRYRLVGDYRNARLWIANRLQDAEKRLETIEAVTQSIVNATDQRTIEGRRAKLIATVLGSLRVQLEEIAQPRLFRNDGEAA